MVGVSVIIPAYNEEKVLDRAIRSVLSQSYNDLELLVIDDSSTDSTPEIVNSFQDDRVTLFQHSTNRGGSAARNTGFMNAKGEYYALLDADDEWNEKKLENQVEKMDALDANWVAIYCDTYPQSHSAYFLKRSPSIISVKESPRQGGDELIPYILSRSFRANAGSTLLVRSSVVNELGGFDTSFERHQDHEFIIRLLQRGKIAHLPKELVFRNLGGQPSPDKILRAKKRLFEVFSEEVRQAEDKGFDVYRPHLLSLARIYANHGEIRKSIHYFRNIENKSPSDWLRYVITLGKM